MSDRAVADRLAELTERYGLPAGAVDRLAGLLELVAGDPRAPTAIRAPERAVDEHVADALVGLELDAIARARRIADLGSGAGFPGLVLAIARPEANVWLVESNRRKTDFIERAIVALGIANATAVAERAESWRDGREASDLVTARALAPLPVLVEYAAPLLALDGTLVAWKGRRRADEEMDGGAAARATGLELAGVYSVRPWSTAEHRTLYVYSKVSSTPNQFPRRPGMARKRPLQAST